MLTSQIHAELLEFLNKISWASSGFKNLYPETPDLLSLRHSGKVERLLKGRRPQLAEKIIE
jgi:hypothetical protein